MGYLLVPRPTHQLLGHRCYRRPLHHRQLPRLQLLPRSKRAVALHRTPQDRELARFNDSHLAADPLMGDGGHSRQRRPGGAVPRRKDLHRLLCQLLLDVFVCSRRVDLERW